MNNQRRKKLLSIIDRISDILSELEPIRDDEEKCRDNMPESLYESVRYDKIDSSARALDDACYAFEEIIEHIAYAIE
jgi:hypothetical protein